MAAKPNDPERKKKFHDLVSNERNLRKQLAEHHARQFDLEAALQLRNKLDTLLDTISAISLDNQLWERLSDTSSYARLTEEDIENLTKITWSTLPYALETWGYTDPPPPSADSLVDDTVIALNTALSFEGDRLAAIDEARKHLITLTIRVRKQIFKEPESSSPAALHKIASSVSATARELIVPVGASVVGIVVESATTKSDPPTAKMLGKFAEHGTRLGLEALVGRSAERRRETAPSPPNLALSEFDLLAVHLYGVADCLFSAEVAGSDTAAEALLALAQKHAARARKLAIGYTARNDELTRTITELHHSLGTAEELHRTGHDLTKQSDALQSAYQAARQRRPSSGRRPQPFGRKPNPKDSVLPRPERGNRPPEQDSPGASDIGL